MKEMLTELYKGRHLTWQEAKDALISISNNGCSEAHLVSFLTVYKMRPISVEELSGFRDALLELRIPVDLNGREVIDIVGTGGDGKNTFNISTLAAFIVAGAGYPVAKHGNYGVSSGCGSSNVLEHLGYRFKDSEDEIKRDLDRSNICFLHAPLFHPAMKAVAPARRAMGVKTFFNMLGPLVNPARPQKNVFGVYNLALTRLYQFILQQEEGNFAVVYSLDGYDEISLTGEAVVKTTDEDAVLTADDFDLPIVSAEELDGGNTVASAADIFVTILENKGTEAQNSAVLANAALAIRCFHPRKPLPEAVSIARQSLNNGAAKNALTKLINN